MLSLILIALCAFGAAFLALFSGFGLGTLLMPTLAIFVSVPVAIALTAFVHLLNNIFKFFLLIKNINWNLTLKFGPPAIIAAILGAWLLGFLSTMQPLFTYEIINITAKIEVIKIVIGVLMSFFATIGIKPIYSSFKLKEKWFPLGGLLSGFFGGLSGHQGAFRSAFLLQANLTKEQFVATNAAIAVLIDVTRLIIYGITFSLLLDYTIHIEFILTTTVFALLGSGVAYMGLEKITFKTIRYLVAILLYTLGTLLILGII